MKVLIVSHPCATAANQAVFAELRRATGWDLRLVVPAKWRDEFGNALDQNDWPGLEGLVERVPVWFNGNIILHAYRRMWWTYLEREKFDVIYMHHEPYAAATGQVCIANARLQSPAAFGFYSAQNILKLYPPPFSWVERFVHRTSRFAFPVSETVGAVLAAKKTGARCTVCPLPVDPAVYYPHPPDAMLLPHTAGEPVLGYVGRLVHSKGLGTLASALVLLRDRPWKLHVIGSGEGKASFEALLSQGGIRDRVVFHDFVPHLKIPEYLSAMDCVIVPSETQPTWKEQFGRVIIEAMACGTPVVGSDSGEIPVLISASGGGLIFPERDAPALADAICKIIALPQQGRCLAHTGREWVLANASVKGVAQRMAEAMEDSTR